MKVTINQFLVYNYNEKVDHFLNDQTWGKTQNTMSTNTNKKIINVSSEILYVKLLDYTQASGESAFIGSM